MRNIASYMDEGIAKKMVKNDAAIAKSLGVKSATVSRWRSGERAPDEEEAIALARLIGHPEEELIAASAAARTKSPAAKAVWARIVKHYAVAASLMGVAAALGVTLFLTNHQNEAYQSIAYASGIGNIKIIATLVWGIVGVKMAAQAVRAMLQKPARMFAF